MCILFSTFGSLGDLHPYLAIALEAKRRGHDPIIATAPKYRAKVENLGLQFRAVRPDIPAEADFGPLAKRVMDLQDGPRYLFQEILSPALRDSYADLLEASEDADLIITHPATMASPLVAQKLKKPWLSSALAPISLWSHLDPPVPPTTPQLDFLRALGPVWPRIMFALGRAGTQSWCAEVGKFRREIGVESLGHPMFEGQYSPFGTLALFSKFFAAPQPDWPQNTTATGFCFYDAEGYTAENESPRNESPWREWANSGPAPMVFTLGSSAVFTAGDFWKRSIDATQKLGQRAILLTGKGTDLGALPDSVLQLEYAPHSEIFPVASLIVHQGGAGTTAQALRAGVPQIVMPFAHDQPDHARRLVNLGVAVATTRRKYGLAAVSSALEKLDSLSQNARELGEKIRAENGPLNACEAMERVALPCLLRHGAAIGRRPTVFHQRAFR